MHLRNLKILVVDDQPVMRKIITHQLNQMHLKNVRTAESGDEALEILDNDIFDVVLCDWNMPGTDGLAVLKAIRGNPQLNDLGFILVTGEGDQERVVEAINAGVDNYIVKPLSSRTLEQKLRQAVKSLRPASRDLDPNRFSFSEAYKRFIRLGDGHVPAFLFCGRSAAMFDPGVSAFGPLYLKQIQALPKAVADRITLLLTHSHFDHCGAAPYLLRKLPHASIGASARAAEVLVKPGAIALIQRFNAEYEAQMAAELAGEDTSFEGLPIDLKLREGDRVELDSGETFTVLETPGHTRDCLAYFFPEEGVLVAGEAGGVPDAGFIHSIFLSDFESYLASMEKLKSVEAEALCIAHAGILSGRTEIREYLSASVRAARQYREKIEAHLDRFSGDADAIVEKITAEEYDSRATHLLNRDPFKTNLRAKINAVLKLRAPKPPS